MPAQQTLSASRNATWGPQLNYDYSGPALPLSGARISMQLRMFPGQPGPPQLEITSIPFIDRIATGTPGNADETRRLTLSPFFTSQQLITLEEAAEPGGSLAFAFDILISYADQVIEILSSGQFIVSPGVTTA